MIQTGAKGDYQRGWRPPSADDIASMGEKILAGLPEPIRQQIGHVPITILDWPDEAMLDEMGIDDPLDLTGLFSGASLAERGSSAPPRTSPDMIFLFRMPLLFEWCERAVELDEVIFDVLTHEIGHFFGMSEAQVLRLEGRED